MAKPNIVQIITDQQTAAAMSCAGNKYLRTPAMDSLAAEGIRFERAYISNPLCVCSRAGMLTGLMPSQTVFLDPAGFPRQWHPGELRSHTLGWLMRDAGYDVAYSGKWHAMWMGGPPDHGYKVLLPDSLAKGTNFYYGREPETTHAAVEYLRRPHKKPFFLTVSLIQPHGICFWGCSGKYPYFNPPPWADGKDPWDVDDPDGVAFPIPPLDMHPGDFIEKCCPPLPANFEIPGREPEIIQNRNRAGDEAKYSTPKMNFYGKGTYTRDWSREDIFRAYLWTYYRLVEYVDNYVGLVLKALADSGLRKNTIVVFTSDHGDMTAAHRMRLKQCLYEECIRVPLIVAGPGVAGRGRVDDGRLMDVCTDWMRTVCDYAGAAVPDTAEGLSWRPLLEGGGAGRWRKELVVECNEGLMLRRGDWKYCVYEQSPKHPEQLFNLKTDPGEMHNLAGKAAFGKTLNDCRSRLRRWRARLAPPPKIARIDGVLGG